MFSTNVETRIEYVPGDPILIKTIVSQLKSQGVFDQFRKECISDVDTKPAYQNLCHRVDGRVESYLSDTKWGPDLNKNQLRENIRKHVNECTFVDSGISRIVDQLVNPRINTVLVPKVEDIVYSYLGIERPHDEKYQMNGAVLEKSSVYIENHENNRKELNSVLKSENDVTFNEQVEPPPHKDIVFDFKNGIQQEPLANDSTNLNSFNACSDIESDEDDISPPFEPHEKSDTDMDAESDYSMDVPDSKCDLKSEPSTSVEKSDTNCDKIARNLERICGEESRDSATSSCTDKVSSRKPSLSLDVPNTPSINYETSDESQDDHFKRKNPANLRRESTQNETCPPDTSSMDSFAEKVPEDDQESPSNVTDDNSSTIKLESTEEPKRDDTDSSQQKRRESQPGDSKDSKRDEKHSDRKKESRRSDKHESSRSDKDRKSSKDKDKDRSNPESKNRTTKDKHSHDRKEGDKSKNHEKSSKDREPKHRESSKSSSNTDKSRSSSSRTKSEDSKDDRKKKNSSSKHDDGKDREKSKHKKEDSSDAKKSRTQCNTDGKKTRTDRRSSDRDSNGPSSSSRSSSHRSSSKTDKEKHRHSSSSSSSSQKSKKSVETKDSTRSEDALFNIMLSVTGGVPATTESLPTAKVSNIENTSSLLDILNEGGESKISNSNVSHHRKMSSSSENKEVRKEDDDSTKKKSEKKTDGSKRSKSNSSKNLSVGKEASAVKVSDLETKKPKIARNAADILRIMELRKAYKEKIRTDQLLQQQGKENTNLEIKKEIPTSEIDQKSILSERSVDNCVINKIDRSEKISSDETMSDSFGDCKLKIKRVDSHYQLVNGSCNVDPVLNEQSVVNNNDVSMSDNDNGNRTENSIDVKRVKPNMQLQSKDVKINGSLKDHQQLMIGVPSLENVLNEGIRTKKASFAEEIDEVRYFEPAELDMNFKNFVAKRIKESEEMCLENFSILLKCPERYDYIFRNQFKAKVTRAGGKSVLTSPFKYNSEIIDNKIGNEKGIMMRIKKTLPENEVFTPPFGMSNSDGLQKKILGETPNFESSDFSNKFIKGVSIRRKTLGMKRPLTNSSKSISDYPAKIVKLHHVQDTNGMLSLENSCLMPESKTVGEGRVEDGSYKSLVSDRVSCNSTLDTQRSTGTSHNLVHSSGPSTPKIHKPMSQEQKRKQFYYDANDLYKPRPSFLVSSRRSRGLNQDKT